MSRFPDLRKFSNEGSTLVEVLGRYLDRRRRNRLAKHTASNDRDSRPRAVAGTRPSDPSRRTGGG